MLSEAAGIRIPSALNPSASSITIGSLIASGSFSSQSRLNSAGFIFRNALCGPIGGTSKPSTTFFFESAILINRSGSVNGSLEASE